MSDDTPEAPNKVTGKPTTRTSTATSAVDLSNNAEDDYSGFKPMTHAATSTEVRRKDPARILLLVLATAAVISVVINTSTGSNLPDAVYLTALGIIPALIAVFASPWTDFGWLNKYWFVTRAALIALTFMLIFPVGVNLNQIREAIAIYGAAMIAALLLEYLYRRRS